MTASVQFLPATGVFRTSRWDAALVGLALIQGVAVCWVPSIALIAVGLWWNSNTVSHNFIHNPFFRRKGWNAAFSLYLSLLLGVPQSLWKRRHLQHHGLNDEAARVDRTFLRAEIFVVATLWTVLLIEAAPFFIETYLPGYFLGLILCAVQGHYEHRHDTSVGHYGALYNWLFFNDGFHAQHHADPQAHWRSLRDVAIVEAPDSSRWPPILRWLETSLLDHLEFLVLRSQRLQRFLIDRHYQAIASVSMDLSAPRRIAIVGGGLFPRTALVLQRLYPSARLVLIDLDRSHLARARSFRIRNAEYVRAHFKPHDRGGFDWVVIPLAYRGSRKTVYNSPPAPVVLVHDWLWRPRGRSAIVSPLLMKRINRLGS